MRCHHVKRLTWICMVFLFSKMVLAQEGLNTKSTSWDFRTGFAMGQQLKDRPALNLGLAIQRVEDHWIYGAEIHHVSAAFSKRLTDEPRKDIIWDVNVLMGYRFLLGPKKASKISISAGLGVQVTRRSFFRGPVGGAFSYQDRTNIGIGLPVRLDVTSSKKVFGTGFYFYGHWNSDASHYGAGILVPLITY